MIIKFISTNNVIPNKYSSIFITTITPTLARCATTIKNRAFCTDEAVFHPVKVCLNRDTNLKARSFGKPKSRTAVFRVERST